MLDALFFLSILFEGRGGENALKTTKVKKMDEGDKKR